MEYYFIPTESHIYIYKRSSARMAINLLLPAFETFNPNWRLITSNIIPGGLRTFVVNKVLALMKLKCKRIHVINIRA